MSISDILIGMGLSVGYIGWIWFVLLKCKHKSLFTLLAFVMLYIIWS